MFADPWSVNQCDRRNSYINQRYYTLAEAQGTQRLNLLFTKTGSLIYVSLRSLRLCEIQDLRL